MVWGLLTSSPTVLGLKPNRHSEELLRRRTREKKEIVGDLQQQAWTRIEGRRFGVLKWSEREAESPLELASLKWNRMKNTPYGNLLLHHLFFKTHAPIWAIFLVTGPVKWIKPNSNLSLFGPGYYKLFGMILCIINAFC